MKKNYFFSITILIVFIFINGYTSFQPKIPVAKSIENFTNEDGIHQNSREQAKEKVSMKNPTKNSVVLSGTENPNPVEKTPNISLPASVNLNIPFQPRPVRQLGFAVSGSV